jgi:hypothetical protein
LISHEFCREHGQTMITLFVPADGTAKRYPLAHDFVAAIALLWQLSKAVACTG